MQAVVFA